MFFLCNKIISDYKQFSNISKNKYFNNEKGKPCIVPRNNLHEIKIRVEILACENKRYNDNLSFNIQQIWHKIAKY